MRTVLVTLADGRCKSGQEKMTQSAKELGKVDSVENWSWQKFKHSSYYSDNVHIFNEKRGLGYWSWKPFIILDTLQSLKDGDVVLYHDAGRPCYDWHIDYDVRPFIKTVIDEYKGLGIVFGPWNHGKMTKRDCFIHMQCDEPRFHNHKQVSATWSIWQKNPFCLQILEEWKSWVVSPSRIVTDDPSTVKEHSFYQTHRHDQSILTNILLKYVFNNSFRVLHCKGYEKNINNILKGYVPESPEYAMNEAVDVKVRNGFYIFYDVFIHDEGGIYGIGPYYPDKIHYDKVYIKCRNKEFYPEVVKDPHNHTNIMKFNVKCGKQERVSIVYEDEIVKTITLTKHEYEAKNVVATTMFKNCAPFLEQWLTYHRHIGVEHFYLYDNASDDYEEVKQICDRCTDVTLIRWPYAYKTPGRSNSLSGQTAEQNTSLYKYSNHKWMLMTDLDEYVYSETSSLLTILQKYNDQRNDICGLTIPCQWFGCGQEACYDTDFIHKLVWRKENANKPKPGCSPKQIVIPKNVEIFSVHRCIKGKREIEMDASVLRFNHYFTLTNSKSRYVANTTGLRNKHKNTCNCDELCAVRDTGLSEYVTSNCNQPAKQMKKFVFVSIPKNASQSIFNMFSIKLKDHSSTSDYGIFDNHCRAALLKSRYNDYDSRFKFCFVRNPYERLVSWFNYHKNGMKLPLYKRFTFEQWVKADFPHHWGLQNGTRYRREKRSPLDQYQFIYDDNDNLLVDFIGHMETFDEDFKYICSKVDYKPNKIEHKNKSTKSDWKSYYTGETFALTQKRFAKDIKLFGYQDVTLT